MKKLCLLVPVICFLSLQPINAQFEKGKMLVSLTSTIGLGNFGTDLMNLGITTEKIKYSGSEGSSSYSTFGINLLPRGGYFIIDNLAAGIDLLVSISSEKSKTSDYKYNETTLVNPWVKML
jgi:hypothetical protein